MSSQLSESDKLAIIELILEGHSTKDIASVLPGVNERSIAAIRAHVTRGTYDLEEPHDPDHPPKP